MMMGTREEVITEVRAASYLDRIDKMARLPIILFPVFLECFQASSKQDVACIRRGVGASICGSHPQDPGSIPGVGTFWLNRLQIITFL